MTHKHCPKCGNTKPVSAFSDDRRHRDGLESTCKACEAKRKRLERKLSKAPLKSCAKYRAANPEKIAAHNALRCAVERGEIKVPIECERCRSVSPLRAHHPSYAKKHWLDVEWICKACHSKEHVKEGSTRARRSENA